MSFLGLGILSPFLALSLDVVAWLGIFSLPSLPLSLSYTVAGVDLKFQFFFSFE